ncbi:3-hydroxyacyl-CoA dehydrogenase [Subtercola boreus]|uniref:3-hydroxyacyl-CoA dehydrogenase n=1 Tax=Subtercola boreus TaxID=120213 RepID=A0A3E0VK33_9MICO|nr:3-hydroxyacyl-CoA dehydrogenase NAD-binding domain-containing protein [Subtercola boreus]RFA09995.1 3-hydroxyacyl-CoA dehydrogenase [Subtercola boreus]TQL52859.1 3-hydroxyacyl-CoA dehydrogenase/enoyl-CoA hydratase/3-hydroxybutyryl-CoA epimerase [Subtercola boreus]
MSDSSTTTHTPTIRWEKSDDGIVILTLDDPNHSANTMNADYVASLDTALEQLTAEFDSVTGVILTSAKTTFVAGGDLNEILSHTDDDAAQISAHVARLKAQLRTLETYGRPVVAALNGAALGGGLEIALATHHRVLADVRGAVVGFPEVGLGLLPGGGGIVRSVRMLGIAVAIGEVLTTNRRFRPQEALAAGLVDEVVSTVDGLVPAARAWILSNPDARQPWDRPGHTIPGGAPSDPRIAATIPAYPATLRKTLKGVALPAPRAILAAAIEGADVDFETAEVIETRYFVSLATSRVAKNLITTFFDLRAVNAGASRPVGFEVEPPSRIGVLGAGMMGAGIAYVSAKAGLDVVLKDVSIEAAERGRQYSARLVEKDVDRGRSTAEQGAALLARIRPTADPADFSGVDFVIEAVFESVELKQAVFQEIQNVVRPDSVLGSNTSTLPITTLAEGVERSADFIGIHFFSPVDRMPLVEIITGRETSERTLARAFDFARQIGKSPIVVNDSRGFFTSRVIMTFLNEAVAALGEGVDPASIEQAGLQAGYPAGPLQLLDELTLTLPRRVRDEATAATSRTGDARTPHGADAVIDRMIDEFDRPGRSSGRGFYEYDENGRRTRLWPGLRKAYPAGRANVPFDDLKERMLFAEAIETVKCFDEGVLRSAADANVGSLLGIGFPAWTGGVVQYVESYPGGIAGFVDRARELSARYGERFAPPDSLVERAGTSIPSHI